MSADFYNNRSAALMKKALNRGKKKSVIYMQCIYKGDLFNEDYTLWNCYYFV